MTALCASSVAGLVFYLSSEEEISRRPAGLTNVQSSGQRFSDKKRVMLSIHHGLTGYLRLL